MLDCAFWKRLLLGGRTVWMLVAGLVALLSAAPASADVILNETFGFANDFASAQSLSAPGYQQGGPLTSGEIYGTPNLSTGLASVSATSNGNSGTSSANSSLTFSNGVLEIKGSAANTATSSANGWYGYAGSQTGAGAYFTIDQLTRVHINISLRGGASLSGNGSASDGANEFIFGGSSPSFVSDQGVSKSAGGFSTPNYSFSGDVVLMPGLYVVYGGASGAAESVFGGSASDPSSFDVKINFVVPEPTTLAIVGLGLLGCAGWGWRRRRQAVAA